MFTDIVPQPGVVKISDSYSVGPVWFETEKARFHNGILKKIGGWQKYNDTAVTGSARALFLWRKLDGTIPLATGTECYFYVYEGGTQYEVTPFRATGSSLTTTPFTTGSVGDATITVTHTSHGAVSGDIVVYTFGTGTSKTWDGVTINESETYVITYVDANTYTIEASSGTASSGSTTNSADGTVTGSYTINCGPDISTFAPGWGALTWGSSTWGTPRSTSSIALDLRFWSIDNWGEDLIAAYNGGTIYKWDVSAGSVGTRLTAISGAPSSVYAMLVSEDRHMIAFGAHDGSAFDPLLVRWCDQEDYTTWTAAITNTAGSKRLGSGNKIVSANKMQRQILILTDVDAYGMQFIGPPYTFGIQKIGTKCGGISPKGCASTDTASYWMGRDNFYMYNGKVSAIPCPLHNHVFKNINKDQQMTVFAGVNRKYNEIWWFYPSANSDNPDRYVVYNHVDNFWFHGTIDRLAWTDNDLNRYPLAVDSSGYIYDQEYGANADGAAMTWYAETGAFELGRGDKEMFIDKIAPAVTLNSGGDVTFTMYAKKWPNSTERSKSRTVDSTTTLLRPRMRGRQFRFRWGSSDLDNTCELGRWRTNPKNDGDN